MFVTKLLGYKDWEEDYPTFLFVSVAYYPSWRLLLYFKGKKKDIFCNCSVCSFLHVLLILSGNFSSIFPASLLTQQASLSLTGCSRTSCPTPFVTCCGIYRKMCIEPGWMKRMWETRGVQLLCSGRKKKIKRRKAKQILSIPLFISFSWNQNQKFTSIFYFFKISISQNSYFPVTPFWYFIIYISNFHSYSIFYYCLIFIKGVKENKYITCLLGGSRDDSTRQETHYWRAQPPSKSWCISRDVVTLQTFL